MVEEEVEDDDDAGENNVQVVGPPPTLGSMQYKTPSNYRTEDGEWNGGDQYQAVGDGTVFIGNQLSNDDGEGELDRGGETR